MLKLVDNIYGSHIYNSFFSSKQLAVIRVHDYRFWINYKAPMGWQGSTQNIHINLGYTSEHLKMLRYYICSDRCLRCGHTDPPLYASDFMEMERELLLQCDQSMREKEMDGEWQRNRYYPFTSDFMKGTATLRIVISDYASYTKCYAL